MSTTPRYADPESVREASNHWNDGQIVCRSLTSHRWRSFDVIRPRGSRTLVIIQQCAGCKNKRRRAMSEVTGHWTDRKWHPHYEPGYLLKGLGRLGEDGKALLRLKALTGMPIHEGPEDER